MSKSRSRNSDFDNPHQWRSPSHFKRLTANHERIIQSILRNPVTIVNGPAGALKTFLALQTSLRLLKQGSFEKILYIRQNIQRPNEKGLGFRPGEESEKLSPLLKPIEDNLTALVPPGELDYLLRARKIEGSDIEMIRGRSPLETILILDEAQNADLTALETVMTRKPESSKLILLGDFKGQRDLFSREFDAFELVCEEFGRRSPFSVINLNYDDILRDPLIREIIEAFAKIRESLNP